MNGRCFVIFFFVLSGFVLAAGLWQGDQRGRYVNYAARRIARILPSYLVAGLLAIVVAVTMGKGIDGARDYFFLTGTSHGIALNQPSWSLVYELRISLLIPLICWCIMRKEALTTSIFVVLFLIEEASSVLLHTGQFPYSADTVSQAILVTARFAVCFYAGVWLAKQVVQEKKWVEKIDRLGLLALSAAAYLLMSTLLDQFCTIGAVIIILLALRSEFFKQLLNRPSLQWLGRISYSLYLTHFLIIALLLQFLPLSWPMAVRITIAIITSLGFAEIFHRLIEAPSIALSRTLGRERQI